MFNRVLFVVFDGFGIGSYVKDESYNSLENALKRYDKSMVVKLKTLNSWGLSPLRKKKGNKEMVCACYGRTRQQSIFCDSFTAHWEMAGEVVNEGVTFANGVPEKYVKEIKDSIGLTFIGNETCYEDLSLLDPKLLKRHREEKKPILLTIPKCEPISTVSIMAYEDVIPFEKLDSYARRMAEVLKGENEIGRIVAKTLKDCDGYLNDGEKRADYALFSPPDNNLLHALQNAGINTYATGKINGLFNGEGFTKSKVSWDNKTVLDDTLQYFHEIEKGLVWANFNSLDRPYGHKGDVSMWLETLAMYDDFLAMMKINITEKDLLILTGDHGCDPTGEGKHTREWNPLFIYNPFIIPRDLGEHMHSNIGKTIAENFGVNISSNANSFMDKIVLYNK